MGKGEAGCDYSLRWDLERKRVGNVNLRGGI